MSQRSSGYAREPLDRYETPAWVTDALVPHINKLVHRIWEPASGSGAMADALREAGFHVHATDIEFGADFLAAEKLPELVTGIVTNPPCGKPFPAAGSGVDIMGFSAADRLAFAGAGGDILLLSMACNCERRRRSKKYLVCGDKYWRRNGKLRLAIRHTDGDPLEGVTCNAGPSDGG